jgi:ABC-type multidrug transport system fused ATPase/permease subunit
LRFKQFQLDFLQSGETATTLYVAIICTTLLLISTFAKFIGEKLFIDLRFAYTRFSIKRGIHLIFKYWKGGEEEFQLPRSLVSLVKRDSIYCGRIATLAASIAAPLLEFIVSTLVALQLYPLLTIIIGITSLLAVRFLHRISKAGSFHSLNREKYASQSTQELKDYVLNNTSLFQEDRTKLATTAMPFPKTETWLYSMSRYVMAVPLSRLVTGILIGVVVGLIVLGLGARLGTESNTVSKGLFYLIALRYMIKSFQEIISAFSSLNRFYPQAVRYKKLLQGELSSHISPGMNLEGDEEEI